MVYNSFVTVNARKRDTQGLLGNNYEVLWSYNKKTCTMTFKFAKKNVRKKILKKYKKNKGAYPIYRDWIYWIGYTKKLVYKEGLKDLYIGFASGDDGFSNVIESISFPSTMKLIPDHSYEGCSYLRNVTFKEGVEYIGSYAFECPGIKEVTLPKGLKYIGYNSFGFVGESSGIHMNDDLEHIGACAFYHSNITEIDIPDSVEYIGQRAFWDCYCLKRVKLPDGLMTIENDLFRYDSNLESCSIPKSVLVIKDRAFGYTGIHEITIPSNVEVLGSAGVNEGIFLGCVNLKKIRIESQKLKTINKGALSGLPNNVVIEVPIGYKESYERMIKNSAVDSEMPKKYNVVEVDVPDNDASYIQLNRKSISVKRGLSYKLRLMYADESEDVTWITDDAQIASVDETGLVMANEIGQTKISVRYKGKTYECNVVVEIEDSNNDAKLLKKLIKKQNKDGGDVYMSSNIKDKDQYTWENGRLVSIDWGDRGAHGFIDLNEFTYLRSFRCDGNNSYVRGIEADNLRFLKEIDCSSDVPDGNIHVENSKNVVVNKKCPY